MSHETDFRGSPKGTPVGIFLADREGRCVYANERWCEIAGMTAAEAVGEGWARALHPEDRERVGREWSAAVRTGQPFRSHYRFRDAQGTTAWVLGQGVAQRGEGGEVTGFVGAITDVTREHEVEQALVLSEQQLRLALEVTRAGTWEWNVQTGELKLGPGWHPLESNPRGGTETNVEAGEKLIHPEDLPQLLERLHAHLEGRSPAYECEYRVRNASGEWCWNQHRGSVVERDRDGRPLRMIGLDLDVTGHKSAEAELSRRRRQLRVLAARLELAEERERRRIATRLHDDVGQSLAAARMLLGEPTGSHGSGSVPGAPAEQVAAFLEDAIRQVRTLTFELSSPLLHELGLRSALEGLCSREARQHGLRARLDWEGEPESLDEDLRVLLFRSVRELFRNVARHARAAHLGIAVRNLSHEIRILVEDDGIGFVPELVPGFGPDAGFGLFSIQEKLEPYGGRLEIESAPGRGTRVLLVQPIPGSAHA